MNEARSAALEEGARAEGTQAARLSRRVRRLAATALACVLAAATLGYHQVDKTLTSQDIAYIPRFLDGVPPPPPARSYEDEVTFIAAVQRAVLRMAPGNDGLPFDRAREPKDLYEARTGLCFDRSRAIEKILLYHGFETRHVSLYARSGSSLKALLTPGTPSHAVTEVRTGKGWLVVDSNAPWLSLGVDGLPVPLSAIAGAATGAGGTALATAPPDPIYKNPFTFVYGLYSRHGRFYAPYNAIPDVHFGELAHNLID